MFELMIVVTEPKKKSWSETIVELGNWTVFLSSGRSPTPHAGRILANMPV